MESCTRVGVRDIRSSVKATSQSVWLMGSILLGLILIAGIGFFEEDHSWWLGGLFLAVGFAAVSYLFHSASQMGVRAERSAVRRCSIQKRNMAIGLVATFAGIVVFILAQASLGSAGVEPDSTIPAQLGFSVAIGGAVWTAFAFKG